MKPLAPIRLPAAILDLVKGRCMGFDQLAWRLTRNITRDEKTALRHSTSHCKSVTCRFSPRRGVGEFVWRLVIQQPTAQTFELLQHIAESCPRPRTARGSRLGMYANKVEVALDLLVAIADDAITLGDFVKAHIVQLRSRGLKVGRKGRTYYLRPRKHQRPGLVVYDDRASKLAGLPCVHIEWRETGRGRVRRLGLRSPADFMSFDFRQFWTPRLLLERLNKDALGKQILRQRRNVAGTYRHRFAARTALSVYLDGWHRKATAQEVRVGLRTCPQFRPEACMARMDCSVFLPA